MAVFEISHSSSVFELSH